ncbi:MAG: YceD family protein [Bacilli bacterium]|nr:YceD family protein [Bacilli bacterium]
MNIDLTRLNNNIEKEILVDKMFEVTEDQLGNTDLIDLKDVSVKGVITKDDIDYNLNFNIKGLMILKCSVTLELVEHPFNININGKFGQIVGETSEIVKKNENTIDIYPIIWENILVEIPMKVVSDKAKNFQAEGVGWKLITESESKEEINPELEKLKKLL